jgi:hypothetical protein
MGFCSFVWAYPLTTRTPPSERPNANISSNKTMHITAPVSTTALTKRTGGLPARAPVPPLAIVSGPMVVSTLDCMGRWVN